MTTLLGILSMLVALESAPDPASTAVRAAWMIQGFDFKGVGMEVAHSLSPTQGMEASVAGVDLSRGYQGTYGQVLFRLGLLDSRHDVSFGIGPGVLDSGAFGFVWFAVPELAYEYRPEGGVTVAVGLGLPVTLNDSRDVPCEESWLFGPDCFLVRTQFKAGQFMPRLRVAVGYSF